MVAGSTVDDDGGSKNRDSSQSAVPVEATASQESLVTTSASSATKKSDGVGGNGESGVNETTGQETEEEDLATALASVILGDDEEQKPSSSRFDPSRNRLEDSPYPHQNQSSLAEQDDGKHNLDVSWWPLLSNDQTVDEALLSTTEPVSDYLFTNEELAEALRFIGEHDDGGPQSPLIVSEPTNNTSTLNDFHSHPLGNDFLNETELLEDPILEDLQYRDIHSNHPHGDDDDDSAYLLPVDDLDNLSQIFDDEDNEDGDEEAPISNEESGRTTAASNAGSTVNDLKTDEILEQLQGLSLSLPLEAKSSNLNTYNDDDSSDIPPLQDIEESIPDSEFSTAKQSKEQQALNNHGGEDIERDDLPPYFYCQPCGGPSEFFPTPLSENFYYTDIDAMMAELGISPEVTQHETEEATSNDDNPTSESQEGDGQPPAPPRPVASPELLAKAEPFLETFGVKATVVQGDPRPEPPKSTVMDKKGERSCLGHRERILSVRFSVDGTLMATASADSTIRIWRPSTNELLHTISNHNSNYECLRVAWASGKWHNKKCDRHQMQSDDMSAKPINQDADALLATAGADGQVFVFHRKSLPSVNDTREEWEVMACIDHTKGMSHYKPSDAEDRPQIYALQFIDNWQVSPAMHCSHGSNRVLLTSSENHIHVWELIQEPKQPPKLEVVTEEGDEDEEKSEEVEQNNSTDYPWHLREVFSIGFGDLHSMGYGVSVGRVTELANSNLPFTSVTGSSEGAFGGDRNPNGVIYVFDAAYCPTNGLLGVALSDGSLRLLNGRGVCVSVLQLPGVTTHLTSFCWDATGTQLATSVASTGHVVTWEIILDDSKSDVQKTSCRAVLGGGHDRTVFGMLYCGSHAAENGKVETEPFLMSWGVDGRVVLWDAQAADEEVDAPIATLVNNPEYPIYGVDFDERTRHLALVGGSGDGGFIGIPVKLFDVFPESREKIPNTRENGSDSNGTDQESGSPKKLKLATSSRIDEDGDERKEEK